MRLDCSDPQIVSLPEFRAWRTVIQFLYSEGCDASKRAAAAYRAADRCANDLTRSERITRTADEINNDADQTNHIYEYTRGAYELAKWAVEDNVEPEALQWSSNDGRQAPTPEQLARSGRLLRYFRKTAMEYLSTGALHVAPNDDFYSAYRGN